MKTVKVPYAVFCNIFETIADRDPILDLLDNTIVDGSEDPGIFSFEDFKKTEVYDFVIFCLEYNTTLDLGVLIETPLDYWNWLQS